MTWIAAFKAAVDDFYGCSIDFAKELEARINTAAIGIRLNPSNVKAHEAERR
ncbi:MAG: hypothetical protein QME41_10035 [Actinomycetota bacterium]|nr:hypothetical protein [Actinomycetota bacterium]